MTTGVLVVDKPRGPTSHDVVSGLRKKLKTRAIGHAGTLDPLATGVLVICVGEATKLVPWLTADDKEYVVTIRLGETTPTLDAGSEVDGTNLVRGDWQTALDEVLRTERARTEQVPPVYSAIHKDGERAHARARRGEVVELAPRPVEVRALEVLGMRERELDLRVACAKGYYVRSLARDLAAGLGTLGYVTALRRTRSGGFTLADVGEELMPLAIAARRALPAATLDATALAAARVGKPVPASGIVPFGDGPHVWFDESGTLVAVGQAEGDVGRVIRGFNG